MDANKSAGEEARRQLHKNAMCNLNHKRCTLMDPPHMAVQKQDDQHEHTFSQLCEDTGCFPEDLPRAINDREEWRERVRDIRATSANMMIIVLNRVRYVAIKMYLTFVLKNLGK